MSDTSRGRLWHILRRLEVVRLRSEGLTFKEIGLRLGVSKERIRHLEYKELSRRLRRDDPDGFKAWRKRGHSAEELRWITAGYC